MQLHDKLKQKTATIGIVGLGYVGLPLAVAFAEAGFPVIGFDIQARRGDADSQGEQRQYRETGRELLVRCRSPMRGRERPGPPAPARANLRQRRCTRSSR